MSTHADYPFRKKAFYAVQQALGDAYDCDREWSAWSSGNMSEDDFSPLYADHDRVMEITDAALDAVGFDDLLEERNTLHQECARLRKAIEDAVNDIRYTIKEMGAKA